jgi:hypothetical protein
MPELLTDAIAKATAALETSVASIIGCDDDDATKRYALAETFAQFQTYLDREANGGKPLGKGRLERVQRSYRQTFEKILGKDGGDDAGGDDAGGGSGGGASDHHASKVADLLVEAGSHPDRSTALSYLLHSPHGTALLHRMSKAADQTAKETSMTSHSEFVQSVVKQYGIVALCKSMVSDQKSYGLTEHEIVDLIGESAQSSEFPSLSKAQAFSRLYTEQSERGRTLQKAVAIAKSMPFVADAEPLVVGGADTRDLSDQSEAIAQLKQLGARKWPSATEAQQFANAFSDPVNRELASKAHVRPVAPAGGIYPYPR